ncbi:cardiolipin synthase [Paenibacillus yonginensis]|uniref:Cardiolipin synthase n=1 Tax=Paenibacillus yonginensis TaxID=1462996 RepID=A0A1B1N6I6_9BACL|nr:cardiolipin synthase [Paenibacillus yonginensis]ANS77032.1 cardiolipin synthase [Paenibacillus yonginensis]
MLWLLFVLIAFIFQIATILILEFRSAPKTVAWLFILFCVPFIGFVIYYFAARDYKNRRRLRQKGSRLFRDMKALLWTQSRIVKDASEMLHPDFVHRERLFKLLTHLSESPITGCNATRALKDGEETFPSMLEAMEQAQDHIHIEFYIFRSDMIGSRFKDVMIRKAREGVKVRLLCDGLGSVKLKKRFIGELKEAGVEFHYFLPPWIALLDKRVNYRNHRKIVVIDGRIGFMGGINIGDDYLGLHPKMGYWRDTHLRLEGDAVYFLQNTFLGDWKLASGEQIEEARYFPVHNCGGREQNQILTSGPDQHWNAIQEMWFGAASIASERIWITTPYFIPDDGIFQALKTAAVSGVDVRIIIPYHSDNRLVHWASLSYVEELLQSGIKFYQYAKGFVHAKVMIIDDLLATVGSANLDMRSFFSNFEMTAILFDAARIRELAEQFEEDLQECRPVLLETFLKRPRRQKAMELLARLLSPLL